MTKSTGVSLASLDARSASESAYEFEYYNQDGEPTGIFFSVLGGEAPAVTAETQRLINARRRKEAAALARNGTGGRKAEVAFTPIEDDIEFSHQLTAVRLVGWRGIDEPFTPELGLRLISTNDHIAAAITAVSNDLANFTKVSPTTS